MAVVVVVVGFIGLPTEEMCVRHIKREASIPRCKLGEDEERGRRREKKHETQLRLSP